MVVDGWGGGWKSSEWKADLVELNLIERETERTNWWWMRDVDEDDKPTESNEYCLAQVNGKEVETERKKEFYI